ncbi:hypothetical protein A2Z33_00985 [Candidatus Gottesmanbacteria bacterium RBG_16_52_11]|uniref:Sortase n=1 Tax=Candidatus Gottesmanbacteria bacterium RBG_16_52_11 TaxID=1798374 RepID=A0A1F5YNW2_9BACT|nr:MAG: hypothetical protein A2Z33_00985 [Candidatus Gottesmanbacteria bacterium RBG_16_52_11]
MRGQIHRHSARILKQTARYIRRTDRFFRRIFMRRVKRGVGTALVFAGLFLLTFPGVYRSLTKTRADSAVSGNTYRPVQNTATESAGKSSGPIVPDKGLFRTGDSFQQAYRIVIPRHNIDLAVKESPVINGIWELSETTASHGEGTANPGQQGNIVIFAHARPGLFGPLREITKGTPVYLLTKDRWYRYTVIETKMVSPDQTEVIRDTPQETLTLYTCSGFLDTKRLIAVALPDR